MLGYAGALAASHAHETHHLDLLVGAEVVLFRLELQRIGGDRAQKRYNGVSSK